MDVTGGLKWAIGHFEGKGTLKERVELHKDDIQRLLRLLKETESKVLELERENADLREKLAPFLLSDDFVKHRGCLFKKAADGSIERDVYCPKCESVMSSMEGFFPYACDPCNFTAPFKGRDLEEVITTIPGQ